MSSTAIEAGEPEPDLRPGEFDTGRIWVAPDGTILTLEGAAGWASDSDRCGPAGETILRYVDPDDRPRFVAALRAVSHGLVAYTGLNVRALAADCGTRISEWEFSGVSRADGGEASLLLGLRRGGGETVRAAEPRADTFRDLVERLPVSSFIAATDDLRLLYVSPQIESLLGRVPSDLLLRHSYLDGIVHPDDRDRLLADMPSGGPGARFSVDHRVATQNGRVIWVRSQAVWIGQEATAGRWYGALQVVGGEHGAGAGAHAREVRLRSLARWNPDLIIVLDSSGDIRDVPTAVGQVSDSGNWRGAAGLPALDWVHPDDRERFNSLLRDCGQSSRTTGPVELRVRTSETWLHIEAVGSDLRDDPDVGGIVVNARDITERKELEIQLSHQAFHDPLTDLPNRALFLDRLELALARSRRQHHTLAVLFLDVDNFKVINDSLGHEIGYQFLMSVAERLRSCVRVGDTVARFGGDEFTLLLEDLQRENEAIEVAERVRTMFRTAVPIAGHELVTTASVGIAFSTTGQESPQDLLRAADVALYRAKHLGKARSAVFERGMTAPIHERLALERDIRRALRRGEFQVFYQPLVDLASGQIRAVEALLRWRHPQRGLVSPDEFVLVAEETGLIVEIGQWVLEQACRQVRAWQRAVAADPPLALSVNLSAYQFRDAGLVEAIRGALSAVGLPPSRLVLEITESLMMEEGSDTSAVLQALKLMGVSLAIDDFGTGYSSLSYLKRFPLDYLKIDRSFVVGLEQDPPSQALVSAIVAAAQALGVAVIAEGVETPAQLVKLRALGCQAGQGYLFARPGTAEDIDPLIHQQVLLPSVRILRMRRPAADG